MTDIAQQVRDHVVRVACETRLEEARRDAAFYRGRAAKAHEMPTLDAAVESFAAWTALAREAEAIVAVLADILAYIPREEDPIDQAKRAAEIAEMAPGEVVEVYGR